MENARIAEIFDEIADLLELQKENPFRIRSYRNAARVIGSYSHPLKEYVEGGENLRDLPGIGEAIAKKIQELLETGDLQFLKELHMKAPRELVTLVRVPFLGPLKAMKIYEATGIQSLAELKKACLEHRICKLPKMGEKTEQNILKGIKTIESSSGRILWKAAADYVESLGQYLKEISSIQRWEIAGSFRRCKETVADLDILVQSMDRGKTADAILRYPSIREILARGNEKVTVRLGSGLQVDFRFFEKDSFGAALLYFTGSKAHNVALRTRVKHRNWKLNEYGLMQGERKIAGKTEDSIYQKLGLVWIPPELREDDGEIQAAEQNRLPSLINEADLLGDLHSHTDATDGSDTLEDMVVAAQKRGYKYLAITDHSKAVRVARGLDDDALRRQADRIRELDASLRGFRVLAGVEVDILKDGRLDIADDVLAELDWVVASAHFHRDMSAGDMTNRILAAIRSGVVHCLGHPLGRIIGRRDPLNFDFDKACEACRENDVCMEIDSQPDRLDLPDRYCRRAKELGVKLSIVSDAHKTMELNLISLGVAVARRGWLEKGDVVNTRPAGRLCRALAKAGGR